MNPSSAEHLLQLHGYRLTLQHSSILKVLEDEQTHLTIEQIHERVRIFCPMITLSTIYRTLDLLLLLGLVRVSHIAGQPSCYEPVTGRTHHHLICRQCHALIHLDSILLGDLSARLEKEYLFHHLTLELLAMGSCERCWQIEQHQIPFGEVKEPPL